jgi:hypothetical protein
VSLKCDLIRHPVQDMVADGSLEFLHRYFCSNGIYNLSVPCSKQLRERQRTLRTFLFHIDRLMYKAKRSFPCVFHQAIFASGVVAPLIVNLGFIWGDLSAFTSSLPLEWDVW